MIAHVGEGRLRVVVAYRIGRVEHTVVAVGIEEVADTGGGRIEEELRLPLAIRIPQIGDPERAKLRRDVLEGVVRQRVGHLDAYGTRHIGCDLIGLELVATDHLDLVGYLDDLTYLIGIVGSHGLLGE